MPSHSAEAAAAGLLDAAPCVVTLPAGCGKTYLVGRVARIASARRQRLLVLTHTHAGVDAIRRSLRSSQMAPSVARVHTIDSWSQRVTRAFPRLSGYEPETTADWSGVHAGCGKALKSSHIAEMLAVSYDYVVVDEYQDCTDLQHALVMTLSEIVPTIILGDPLQAIYDFGERPLVDWSSDLGHLTAVDVPVEPWRWRGSNEELGAFLLDIRRHFERGEPFDIRAGPLRWCPDTNESRRSVCWSKVGVAGSVVVLAQFDPQCEAVARGLGGHFGVMEDLEGKNLLAVASAAEDGGLCLAASLMKFAFQCHANLPAGLKQKGQAMARGAFPRYQSTSALAPTLRVFEALAESPSPLCFAAGLREIRSLGGTLFRKEAWYDMTRAATAWEEGSAASLEDAVRLVRNRARILGRRSGQRTVSRSVLVKGQEFDECVVLGAHRFAGRELYVAMTRPRKSLTVIAESSTMRPSVSRGTPHAVSAEAVTARL